MCEHYVARSASPFRLDELWEFTDRLERYGLAGFEWGAAWIDPAGEIRSHRAIRAFHDDPGREAVGQIETTAALVHLRRPSRLSTLGMPDTQPFDDPRGRYSFSHNGELLNHKAFRGRYQSQGRLQGRADTEVGARWLEDEWQDGEPVAHTLEAFHDTFGGLANLAVLTSDGGAYHYAGNRENPVFTFRLGSIGIAGTGIYSLDRSLFKFVAHGATDRRLVKIRTTISLAPDGSPTAV